ncbi:MAG: sugar phosphate isomerase/epimerase [Lachnospiraceae bacterium]|nr:sugar phosphate isomerase/epimerase [Lachnospiraceae bacterium]
MLKNSCLSCFADEISDSLAEQIALMQELGIHSVEFRSADGKGVADYSCEEAAAAYQTLKAAGISVSALGSPIGKISITEDFEPHFEKFCHVAKLAQIFHTRQIRLFSFYMPEELLAGDTPDAESRLEVLRRLSAMISYAAQKDLVLLHENEKGIYGDTVARCLDLMQQLHGPHFGCTFDFANFVQCGQDPLAAYELLKPYITYVHIKDAKADGTVVPAGQGVGQLRTILQKLDASGYDGYLSLEPHLTDFTALNSLEAHVETRGRTDGPTAFREAWQALRDILHAAV